MRHSIRVGTTLLMVIAALLFSSYRVSAIDIYNPDTNFSANTIVLFIHGYMAADRPIF